MSKMSKVILLLMMFIFLITFVIFISMGLVIDAVMSAAFVFICLIAAALNI